MWWASQKHKVSIKYITLIKDMYYNVVTSVRTSDEDTNDFSINIGLDQGYTLSQEIYKMVSLGVYSLQMMWFWWMRVGQGLTRSWSCGDEF
jgi:hypothetical protein